MKPSIALLLGDDFDYMLTLVMAMGEANFGDADGLHPSATPRSLSVLSSGDAVLIGSSWAAKQRAIDFDGLRKRFRRLIGLDQETSFSLQFPEERLAELDVVIKPNGVYRDAATYGSAHAGKLHLSAPNFTIVGLEARALARRQHRSPAARFARDHADRALSALARPIDPRRPPAATAQFVGTLSNVQRLEPLRRLREAGVKLIGGITGVSASVKGNDGRSTGDLERQIIAGGLRMPRLGRMRYRASMARAKAVLSIAGHGEICFRMAEAWSARRVLVCQDLSHVRTLFPFESGRNVVFCRPDHDDLADVLTELESDPRRCLAIAEQGHADWRSWSREVAGILRTGFAPLLHPA